ncbi:MAG: Alcohol dehydrogenase, class [Planctomycetota bacterium]|nr:Alcohol dehydrogenase, class [Planctomycetota bacterium]
MKPDRVEAFKAACIDNSRNSLNEPGIALSVADCRRLIPLARRASSMKGNPVALTDSELRQILEAAIDR